jgi:hypothetical protein
MFHKEVRIAELHRQDILTEAAQARLVASARTTPASRSSLPSLLVVAHSVRYALTALASIAFGIKLN